jgi:arginase
MSLKNIALIEAPSILGLKPGGVEKLPEALKAQGLLNRISVIHQEKVIPPSYNPQRDAKTNILNPAAIRDFSVKLAEAVQKQQERKRFTMVLGGDCSIIIGCLLALRRVGRHGLFFIDGHADFYQPEASSTGEVADMDLAIVTGRGPETLTNIENLRPLVKEEDAVAFGYRDTDEQIRDGSQDIKATGIHAIEISEIKKLGLRETVIAALQKILNNGIDGFWIHLDADVLDDAIMPAVDYRLSGGLRFEELSATLSILLASQKAVGMSIAIFNPTLDKDGSIAKAFVNSIVKGFEEHVKVNGTNNLGAKDLSR